MLQQRPFYVILLVSILFWFFLLSTCVDAADVTIRWDANTESDLDGYNIYYKTDFFTTYDMATPVEDIIDQGASPITIFIEDLAPGNTVEFRLTGLNLTADKDYYLVVTAFDNEEPLNESGYSNEVNTLDVIPRRPFTPPPIWQLHNSKQKEEERGGCFIGTLFKANNVEEVTTSVGKTTQLYSIAHTDPGESYAMEELAVRFSNNFELSFVNHNYNILNVKDFSCASLGIIYHWTWESKWIYADLGLGFRYAEKNQDIKWLMHKHLLADFQGGLGVKYKCLKLGYALRHFSCPGPDTGMNLDQITLIWEVKF